MERSAPLEPRSDPTVRDGRGMFGNSLDGSLPAELGKLTNLERLCAALRRRRAQPWESGRSSMLTRCGWVQRMWAEQVRRHDRQLDRHDGKAHLPVSAALQQGGVGAGNDGTEGYSSRMHDAAGSSSD